MLEATPVQKVLELLTTMKKKGEEALQQQSPHATKKDES